MTKEQLEEKIKNNEKVYGLFWKEIELNSNFVVTLETHSDELYLLNIKEKQFYAPIDKLFSTRAQAQHYEDNSNVTRTEKLPFITWEEFKTGKKDIWFSTKDQKTEVYLNYCVSYIALFKDNKPMEKSWKATEENFYKAYDIARKLFIGEDL